ncbi:DUF2490 domain-containing protein [Legionella shakespearei]|uniref:DUF2490 domain-containing protein n=1 Tax=Legionella shakespearei DSM 23087 TaxID=1122169 RepID=A0A0W0ZA45_9GAMM|nr:DUF2490 domain-containing protein [Legionella shakespearei]KTD65979.1 hypothetical protein Lsha_0186 [Legionella shakespearei DSM 23087]
MQKLVFLNKINGIYFFKKWLSGLFLILFISLLAIYSGHATSSDSQFWTSITAMVPASKDSPKIRYWLESQNRIGDEVSQLSQFILRPGIGYELTPFTSVWLGYARIYTAAPFTNDPFDENRIWQQLLWSKRFTHWHATVRGRLEQRFMPNSIHTEWRYRHLFKGAFAIPHHDKYTFVLSDELFFHLNDFNHQNNQGFDQNRFFTGFGYKTNKNTTVEIGYLSQVINRIGRENYSGNNLLISLLVNI